MPQNTPMKSPRVFANHDLWDNDENPQHLMVLAGTYGRITGYAEIGNRAAYTVMFADGVCTYVLPEELTVMT